MQDKSFELIESTIMLLTVASIVYTRNLAVGILLGVALSGLAYFFFKKERNK